MFANCQLGGVDIGGPDVCMTPAPPSPTPVPMAYPNIAIGPMATGAVSNVIMGGGPTHTMMTEVKTSNGDNPGQSKGVASATVMGKRRHTTGAFTVIVRAAPITRVTSMAAQNGTNCVGACVAPAQTKVVVLAG